MSSSEKKKAIAEWVINKPKRDLARSKRGTARHVKLSEVEDYARELAICKENLKPPAAPAKPTIHNGT